MISSEPLGPIQTAIRTIIAINYQRLIADSLPPDLLDLSDWLPVSPDGYYGCAEPRL